MEVHFEADQWVEVDNGRRLLKKSAIPTIFRDTSSPKVKAPGERNTSVEVEPNADTERNTIMSDSHNSDASVPTLKPDGKFHKRTKWSNEENEKLGRLVDRYGLNQWEEISQHFTRRTDLQCKVRWQKLSNLRLVKNVLRPWTKEEDDKLKELVDKHGTEKWNFIARHLDKRIGRHCKERWNNIMNPDGSKREQKNTKVTWTAQEKKLLFYYYKLYGNQWAKIAERIGTGRTDNAVKSCWNAHKKKNSPLSPLYPPLYPPVKRGRPKKKFINESSSTMPESKNRESLQTSDSKPVGGPKRRGRKPKNMLNEVEISALSGIEAVDTIATNSGSKNFQVLLKKYAVDSTSRNVPSATTVMSENANSSSISGNVLEEMLQSMDYDEEDISNKRKENIVVQSPSSKNPHQLSMKTPQNYPNKCIHMKPNIHLDVPSTISAIPENSDSSSTFASISADGVLKQNLQRTELHNTEKGINKGKNVTVQSPSSKILYQNNDMNEGMYMDDIVIVNVHSLNSGKTQCKIKSENEKLLLCMLPEDTEGSAEKEYQEETNGKLQTNVSNNQEMNQNDFSCSSAEADCSSPVTDTMEEVSVNQPQCSSQAKSQAHIPLRQKLLEMLQEDRNADCNETPNRYRLSSCNFEQSIRNVSSQFVETLQTSNILPSTSLKKTFLKRKKRQNTAQTSTTTNCLNETPASSSQSQCFYTSEDLTSNIFPSTSPKNKFLKRKKRQNTDQTSTTTNCSSETPASSSQSQCFHTSEDLTHETFGDNQLSSQNDFGNRISNFFNHMQAARHSYEMICGNVMKEFEKLVSEADSSDLGPFSFMKPFLDKHQSNSRSFSTLEFMKLFCMFFGDTEEV